jgi:pseudouridine kinase
MHLTSREKEIADVIRMEPLISQEELARRFGITRSSVAVHISNLMRKGIILGKGYVFNQQASAVIMGESSININVREKNGHVSIDIKYGGSAFGMSRVLSNFGVNVKVITIVGNDKFGDEIINEYQKFGTDINNIYRHPEGHTSKKLLVNNVLQYKEGFCQEDYQKTFNSKEWVAMNCEWLVVEPDFHDNLPSRMLEKAGDTPPFSCTFKNLKNPDEVPEVFKNFYLVALGIECTDCLDIYVEKGLDFVRKGLQNCIITDGSSTLVYITQHLVTDVSLLPNQKFDCQVGLPQLLAGTIYGLSCKYPLRQAVRIGIGSASVID